MALAAGSWESMGPEWTLERVLKAFPGAQRALFRRYHIGGCASCAFQPDETLGALCGRNGIEDVHAVIRHIEESHAEDERIQVNPSDLAAWIARDPSVRLVDVRSREEFDAVNIPGSQLLSQPVMRELMAEGTHSRPLVLVDHRGRTALDAAAYFIGHGLKNVRCLRGGIDAWSREVDPRVRRYELE